MDRIITLNLNNNHTGVYSESDDLLLIVDKNEKVGVVRIVSEHTDLVLGSCLFDEDSFSFMFLDNIKVVRRDFDGSAIKNNYQVFDEYVEECLMDFVYDLLKEVIWADTRKSAWYKEDLNNSKIWKNRKELEDVYFLDIVHCSY